MAIEPVRVQSAQIIIGDERVYSDIKPQITGIQTGIEEEPLIFSFPEEVTLNAEFTSFDQDALCRALGLDRNPRANLVMLGKHWFQPKVVFTNARFSDVVSTEMDGDILVAVSAQATEYTLEYSSKWAKAVHWLWRQWTKLRVLVRKFMGFVTERL